MIILHFHLQPQYKYKLFHIDFTSFHCTGRYELNKLTSFPMCGFIAQLVEHRTGIAEVTGSNPAESLIFFRLLSNCLNWKFTAMITLHFHLQPQFKYELSHINFTCCDLSGVVGSNLTSLKRSQHFNERIEHCWVQHVACVLPPCCDMLRHVGCFLLKFENGQIFHATFVDVA